MLDLPSLTFIESRHFCAFSDKLKMSVEMLYKKQNGLERFIMLNVFAPTRKDQIVLKHM